MKNLFYLLVMLLFISCSEKRVTLEELSKTGGYFYYDGKKFTGIGFDMYNSKQVKHEINYKEGEKDGEEKYYNENGDLTSIYTYKNDELEGPFETYYQSYNGSIIDSVILDSRGTYKNGKMDGEIIECIDCHYEISDEKVHKLYVKGKYVNGVRVGKFQYYTNVNSNFSTVTYDDKGKVIDGTEINSNNYDLFIESRIIKKD